MYWNLRKIKLFSCGKYSPPSERIHPCRNTFIPAGTFSSLLERIHPCWSVFGDKGRRNRPLVHPHWNLDRGTVPLFRPPWFTPLEAGTRNRPPVPPPGSPTALFRFPDFFTRFSAFRFLLLRDAGIQQAVDDLVKLELEKSCHWNGKKHADQPPEGSAD